MAAAEIPDLPQPASSEDSDIALDIKFIELYENEPALWDTTAKCYLDRNERRKALERMDMILQFGVDKISKKINNMRTYYRKEVNKTEDSRTSGAGTNDVYESKWPMYSALDNFLRPMVKKRKSKSNLNFDSTDTLDVVDDSELNTSTESVTPYSKKRKDVKQSSSDLLLQKAIDSLDQSKAEDDESDDFCFGRYVGKSLSALPNNMNKCFLKKKYKI